MSIKKCLRRTGGTAIMIASVGCGAPPLEGTELATEEESLYGQPSAGYTYWNSSEGQGVTIPVCWTTNAVAGKDVNGVLVTGVPYPGYATAKAWVREFVENSWGRVANISFSGWDSTCVAALSGKDEDAIPLNAGKVMFANHPVMIDEWNVYDRGKHTTLGTMFRLNMHAGTKNAYKGPSVHEMGHALGFGHEKVRPDNWVNGNPSPCNVPGVGESGPEPGGDYLTSFVDGNSIMCIAATTLSPGDVQGVQKRYGRKPSGSLVGFRGNCVNLLGGSLGQGAPFGAWPCTGGWNDTLFRPNNTFENLSTTQNGRCLNVSGGTVPNPVIAWGCGDFANERFLLGPSTSEGAELLALGNLCVQYDGALKVSWCNGQSWQRWDLQHPTSTQRYDQIRFIGQQNRCLTTLTTNGAIGEPLTVATCSSTDTKQRFTYPGQGIIKMANNPGLCLNVAGGVPTVADIVLWSGCDLTQRYQNEQFLLRGRVKSLAACMQWQTDGKTGDPVEVQTCSGANNTTQIWDYWL